MTINIEVMILYKQDAIRSRSNENAEIQDVLTTMTDVQILDVTEANPVETDITRKLLFACDEKKSDVILIIGNIDFVERYLVNETLENISDEDQVSERIVTSILNIEKKLNETMPHKTLCTIRNQTLIMDVSGPHKNPKKYLDAVADMILQTVHLIRSDKDQNVSLYDVASTSDNNSTMQKSNKVAVKRRKKSTSPFGLSPPNVDTIKRHKESFPMISMTDAVQKIQKIIYDEEKAVETVKISEACGRILYENVESNYNMPPFRTSIKHGYAVLITDGKDLRKVLHVENTFPPMSLEPGTCVWVNSGAPIPDGATAVVAVKDTKLVKKSESYDTYIEIMIELEYEQNIKPAGYDLLKGRTVVPLRTYISPLEVGLLAASGRKEVTVVKHISIGVLSIGDNLEEPGKPLKPGFVYDINRITLISLLKSKSFHPLDFGIVANKLMSIQNKIEEALKEVNLLVTTGSSNDRDLLKTVLEKYLKADIHFGNVNIKPGKSTIFATHTINDVKKFILGLPGNPTSAFIAAQLFLMLFVNDVHCNFYIGCTSLPICLESQYNLHSRPRIAWTVLEWAQNEKCAMAFSKGNAISDKLVTSIGANALIMLPKKGKKGHMLCKSFLSTGGILMKIPKRINNKNFYNLSFEENDLEIISTKEIHGEDIS